MRAVAIYGPVQEDLRLVEQTLDGLKDVEYPWLAEMMDHVLSAGGKRLRPALALLGGNFYNYDLEQLVPLAASVELLHTATLVHDDVIDNSATRRGRPTANSLFQNSVSVMLGDYMFAHAAELVARTGNIRVIRLFAETLMVMAKGELGQDMAAYDYSQTVRNYFQRIGGKTASLFATACEGGAIISGVPEDGIEALRVYGRNLGMAFQIVDDVLDFRGDEEEMGKPVGSDLMQGTLTLPSLLAMERYPKENPIKKLFSARRRHDHLGDAVQMVRQCGVLEESLGIARDFVAKAQEALSALPDLPARATLAELADYVLERRS